MVFPAIAPTMISKSAAEIVIHIEPRAASSASAIHNADCSQIFPITALLVVRSRRHKTSHPGGLLTSRRANGRSHQLLPSGFGEPHPHHGHRTPRRLLLQVEVRIEHLAAQHERSRAIDTPEDRTKS